MCEPESHCGSAGRSVLASESLLDRRALSVKRESSLGLRVTMGAQGSASRHGDSEQSRTVCARAFTCCSAMQPIHDVDDDASSLTAHRSVFVGVKVNRQV